MNYNWHVLNTTIKANMANFKASTAQTLLILFVKGVSDVCAVRKRWEKQINKFESNL